MFIVFIEVPNVFICRVNVLNSIHPTLMEDTKEEIQKQIKQTLEGTFSIIV